MTRMGTYSHSERTTKGGAMDTDRPPSDHSPVDHLAEEFLTRHRRGERPAIAEYVEQYPEWAEEIRELFPALVMMEQLKPAIEVPTGSLEEPSARPDSGSRPAPRHPERLGDFKVLRV